MNADVSKPEEPIWAYLHGELSEAERLSFEAEVACAPALRLRLEEARQLDRLLGSALPSLGESEAGLDALADQALDVWEREQAQAFQERPPIALGRKAIVLPSWPFSLRRRAWGVAGLAAAAVLVVSVSPLLRETPETTWVRPTFSPLALRGPACGAGATLPADMATRCQKALAAALTRVCEERNLALRRGVTLAFRLQELCNGAFSVTVQARDHVNRPVGEWRGDYSCMAAFLKQAESSAELIASVIAVRESDASAGDLP